MSTQEIQIKINNCNNIKELNFKVIKDHLNIKYAMNGTGKSSIAKIIKAYVEGKDIKKFKTFGSEIDPHIEISENINKVEVFNEDFVNQIVFKESEVIPNAFDVFIKSQNYDEKLSALNERLKELKTGITENEEIITLLNIFREVSSKISFNANQTSIKKNPFVKSILSKENIYKIPKELEKYTPFIQNHSLNIDWIDWKQKGSNYDQIAGCPYCAEELPKSYNNEKDVFNKTYTKASIKHVKDMLENCEKLADYINNEKYSILLSCIKETNDEEFVEMNLRKYVEEMNYLRNKIEKCNSFDSVNFKSEEISKLDEYVKSLKIKVEGIDFFNIDKTLGIIIDINERLDKLLQEIDSVKKDIGSLKGIIQSSANNSILDINTFLKQAGINYEIFITPVSQSEAKTVLKYNGNGVEKYDVNVIKDHLSWGEKNAFGLMLFMLYANSQAADLVILDDPVSSFDSNKKYAIINRLFTTVNNLKSFYKKTVVFLTHDFEPIIDFVVNTKPTGGYIAPNYLRNVFGNLTEYPIIREDIKSVIKLQKELAKNDLLNNVHRIVFLRKYIEHSDNSLKAECAYNLLSSLIHGKSEPDKKIGNEEFIALSWSEIDDGVTYICEYIENFNYTNFLEIDFKKESLINLYNSESNSYLKIQIFRVYLEIAIMRDKIKDDVLIKFIDEVYHIENDYIYYLDFIKYDTIPTHIIEICDKFIEKQLVFT